ncbi:MAG TPA: c-type cytochrome, partial [Cellvibrio sp.]|nr:c-type cytochrome [Cellvibrio sp.]
VDVGNAPADINIELDGNTSFYWPGTRSLGYRIEISDKEDGKITAQDGDTGNAIVQLSFGGAQEQAASAGHQTASANVIGKDLVEANSCTACHQIDAPSVGPSFTAVAERYQKDPEGLAYLVKKIADGGAGAWGETAMPSFAHLNEEDRTALATYVLSHAQDAQAESLPLTGKLALRDHKLTQDIFNRTKDLSGEERAMFGQGYTLSVSYTDKGGEVIGPITVKENLRLIVPRFLLPDLFTKTTTPDDFKLGSYYQLNTLTTAADSDTWRVAPLGEFDLRSVKSIQLGRWITKNPARWAYELRIDQPDGRVVAAGVGTETAIDTYGRDVLKLTENVGRHKLYLAVRAVDKANSELHLLDISFYQ